jgi:predicted lipid-binding transport protein (Tim44 family)
MRNFVLILLISLLSFTFLTTEAQAKRFGGGRSFGMSRSTSSFNTSAASKPFAANPTNNGNRWLGPLAGLAAGGLLASLFMGHGIGSGIMSWLLIGGLALFAWRFLQNRFTPARAAPYSPQSNFTGNTISSLTNLNSASVISFDEAAFLRQSKASFIRLQAAYDNKNLADIREFTTPEVFAEVQLQLHERGAAENQTEVLSVDAQLLNHEDNVASVLFTASIREEKNPEETVKEIWHFQKDAVKSNWLVAGIQQN